MDALFKRLNYYADLREQDREALSKLKYREEAFRPGEEIVTRGEDPGEAFIVADGWAARYITLEDGRSQILNFMLPGDIYDLQVFLADGADHSVIAITRVTVLQVRRRAMLALFESGTRAGAAFWWCALQEEAMLREQIVRNGRRTARERLAHLLLELHQRSLVVSEAVGDTFRLPVSQAMLADALGLSFVHVNRVVREFEKAGWLSRQKQVVTLQDRSSLVKAAGYTDDYLHLDGFPHRLSF